MLAGSTRLAIGSPSISTRMWRLRPFHVLVAIKAAHPTTLCCLHRLAIHDNHRWTRISTGCQARLLVDLTLQASPHAHGLPGAEIVINGAHAGNSGGSSRHWQPVRSR